MSPGYCFMILCNKDATEHEGQFRKSALERYKTSSELVVSRVLSCHHLNIHGNVAQNLTTNMHSSATSSRAHPPLKSTLRDDSG